MEIVKVKTGSFQVRCKEKRVQSGDWALFHCMVMIITYSPLPCLRTNAVYLRLKIACDRSLAL